MLVPVLIEEQEDLSHIGDACLSILFVEFVCTMCNVCFSVNHDILEDTFMAGIKGLDRFDGSRDIKYWLRSIMRNKIVDQIRKVF